MKKRFLSLVMAMVMAVAVVACGGETGAAATEEKTYAEFAENGRTPEWTKDAVFYEVNVRQYTKEGTFKAFEEYIPTLKEMGVTVVWFMPIHPISEHLRSGELGSYYSVTDYCAVNPEFGTIDDFKECIDLIHENGMYVMMDWVANHTGWDCQWITDHPDWYTQDADGNIISPEGMGWPDVADLNYDNADMRAEMINCMKFWVENYDVDGFRCDYASGVPADFWDEARAELQAVKPVYMLAESDNANSLLENAFDCDYAWQLYDDLIQVAKGNKKANTIKYYIGDNLPNYTYKLYFLDNHDKNSYEHTIVDGFGYKAIPAMFALTYTLPGAPLIYSGDEVGLSQALAFTSKCSIRWSMQKKDYREYLGRLSEIRSENEALYTSSYGGAITFEDTANDEALIYHRDTEDSSILVVLNLSDKEVTENLTGLVEQGDKVLVRGNGEDERNLEETEVTDELTGEVNLLPWEYIIIER